MIQQRLRPERDYETGIANSEMPSSPDACQLAAHAGHQIWTKSLDANNAAFFMPPHQVATAVAQFVPQLSIEPQTLNRSSSCLLRRLRRPELRLPSGRGLCWACAKFSTFVTARLATNADWIHPFQSFSIGCILRALNSEFQSSLAGNPSLILEATLKPQLDLVRGDFPSFLKHNQQSGNKDPSSQPQNITWVILIHPLT
jgi:hypothetical protein